MESKYWDDFKLREIETIGCLKSGLLPPVRRVAIFITNQCNFRCAYCNLQFGKETMSEKIFNGIVNKYGQKAIIHITGGEPSLVKWLYPYIEARQNIRFHLNTNAFITPPRNIKRLKISLDSNNEQYFDSLTNKQGAFVKVVKNIKQSSLKTITSITCVLSKETYKESPAFMKYCRESFPNLYAVFFSIYKGDQERFQMLKSDVDNFFENVKPKLEKEMDRESLALFCETIEEKRRLLQGVRFPENDLTKPCYLSLSERVFDWQGNEYSCSHLYRDGIKKLSSSKDLKCQYGCNRRLVRFNQEVENESN